MSVCLLLGAGTDASGLSKWGLDLNEVPDPEVLSAVRRTLVPLLWSIAATGRRLDEYLCRLVVAAVEVEMLPETTVTFATDLLVSRLLQHLGVPGVEVLASSNLFPDPSSDFVHLGNFLASHSSLAHVAETPFASHIPSLSALSIGRAATVFLLQGERVLAARILHWLRHPLLNKSQSSWIDVFIDDAIRFLSMPRSRPLWHLEFELVLLRGKPRLW